MSSIQDIRRRVSETDPLIIDTMIAVALTAITLVMVYVISQAQPAGLPPIPNWRADRFAEMRDRTQGGLAYVLVILTFMPLAFRRKIPWLALALSGTAALMYSLRPLPPAPVILGPMLALYTLAAYSKQRRGGLIALLVAGIVATVPVFVFSSSVRWVMDLVGSFVLLAAAALLGEAERNRREYVAEVELRALEAERTREEEALRRVDEERMRIAREVHDIVAHSLSIVTVQASAAEALMDKDPDKALESIHNIRETGKDALAELRSMLEVLRTGEGEQPTAPSAEISQIDKLVDPLREAGIEVNLRTGGDLTSVPAYASVSAYRIAQEALTNVVRHAGAESVDVDVIVDSASISVTVADDGSGDGGTFSEGHGMLGMRERIEALGGTFGAGPRADGGFRVSATIPLRSS